MVALVHAPGHAGPAVAGDPDDCAIEAGVQVAPLAVVGEESVQLGQQAHGREPTARRRRPRRGPASACLQPRQRDAKAATLIPEALLADADRVHPVRRLAPNGLDAWAQVLASGYEGLVAKDEASPYVGGRTRAWLKVKAPGWTDTVEGHPLLQ